MAIRGGLYRRGWKKSHEGPVAIVSVGNISTGGTGKTPMAEYLLRELQEQGYRPAYLSRGYGRDTRGYLRVLPAQGDGRRFGDEAFQVASKFPDVPVAVCESRVDGLQRLWDETQGAFDCLVLDDAFQHLRIQRDLDLVMIDANRPPWRDLVLPAGNLREFRRGLRRAQVLVLTKFQDEQEVRGWRERLEPEWDTAAFQLVQESPRPFFDHSFPETLTSLRAFAGLGNNAFFFRQLQTTFPQLTTTFSFPDHRSYTPADLRKIVGLNQVDTEKSSNLGAAVVLTSEKDYYRLKGMDWLGEFREVPLFYVPARLEAVWGKEMLLAHLSRIIQNNYGKNKRGD